MSGLYCLFTVLALAFVNVHGNVIELNDASFEPELENMGTTLVMFYAPWCGHCKRLKPEFEKAASILRDNDPPVHLAQVDCTEAGKDTCGKFSVSGYPTLKIFREGELSMDYNGPREVNGIIKYMKSQVGPSSKKCQSQADVDALLKKDEVVVMGYMTDEKELTTFLKMADANRESCLFGNFKDGEKEKIVLHRPTRLHTKLEPSEVEYSGSMSKDDITTWIKDNYHGLVGHRTLDNAKDFSANLVIAYYDVDYAKNTKGTNYWRNRIMKVAKKNPSLTYAISNKDDFMQEVGEFGLSTISDDKPRVVVKKGKKKFVMQDEFSVDNFDKFVSEFLDGKIEAYLKSEDVPEDNDKPVKVAVAKNFEELVEKSDKDVLIEFYAPWCGHCKKLTPIFDELGEKMQNENVEIVKMDATANDVADSYDVRGFPTLFWLPKSTKKPVSYDGGREVDAFIKYIAENASEELKGFDRKGKAKKVEL